jgi:hypothetical protein
MCEANFTDGGEGARGWIPSEDWAEKCRTRVSGEKNPMYGKPGAMLGKKHSAESKLKMSRANKGKKKRPLTQIEKDRMSALHKGNKYRLGSKLTAEHKLKISISGKGKQAGEKHPFYGRELTEEQKQSIRNSNPKSMKILNTETGAIYNSIREASLVTGFSRGRVKRNLNSKLIKKFKKIPLGYYIACFREEIL